MAENLEALRHSASHVMAHAVKELYPDVKLGIGPAIEDGFYYDFDLSHTLTMEDLPKIEKKMEEIIKENHKFEQSLLSKKEAEGMFEKSGEIYKLELIKEIPDEKVSVFA